MIDILQYQRDYAACYADTSYITFIEKYLSTFNASEGKLMPFITFPRQKVFLKSIDENKCSIAIKHRQCGISTLSAAWTTAKITFANAENPENVLIIANKLEQASELLFKIRDFLLQVPRLYWGDEYFSVDPTSPKNTKDIFIKNSKTYLELFNGCKVYARSSGPNAARGVSAVSILIFDEAAFIEDGPSVYSSAVAATASVKKAKIIMVSTPNGKDALYYQTYRQALSHENNFNAVEFKWYQDLRYNKFLEWVKKDDKTGENEVIKEEVLDESGTIKYDEKRWREFEQKGYKPISPWYTDMCKSFNNDQVKIAQELDVSFLGSANNVVAPEFIEQQSKLNVRDKLETMADPLCDETWFYKKPIDGHRYVLGCDPSRGDSNDRTAIEVIDMDGRDENGMPIIEQVAEYVGKKLGNEIGILCVRYAELYNNAFIVVDGTGGVGDAALLTIIGTGYSNVFYDDSAQKNYTVQNPKNNELQYHDKMPGFHFQGNRYPVLSHFAGLIRNNEFKIRSVRVINELDTWIFKENTGRMDHMSGAHDDTITCLAMALFVMQFSINKLEKTINKDKAILNAYCVNTNVPTKPVQARKNPNQYMPQFISDNKTRARQNLPNSQFLWLFK